MADIDRILELLDQATQRPGDFAYPTDEPEQCWRCTALPAADDLGLCEPCADELRAETISRPGERWVSRFVFISCDEGGVATEHFEPHRSPSASNNRAWYDQWLVLQPSHVLPSVLGYTDA